MIYRCYSGKKPSYSGVTVEPSWHKFSNFKIWSEVNFVEGFELDKDIVGDGREYRPDSCAYVPPYLNKLFIGCSSPKSLPLGVSYNKSRDKYQSQVVMGGKVKHLGRFESANVAADVYAIAKSEQIEKLLARYTKELYSSFHVIQALRQKQWALLESLHSETKIYCIKDMK